MPMPYDAKITDKLDWEAELGVIIGPGGKNITEADAMKHVFGYTVINDVSGPRHPAPARPAVVQGQEPRRHLPDGAVDRHRRRSAESRTTLAIGCRLNGVAKQDSNTSYMYFKIPRIIAELSHGMTLEAGRRHLERHARTASVTRARRRSS